MRHFAQRFALSAFLVLLGGCGGSGSSGPSTVTADESAPVVPVSQSRDGKIYAQSITTPIGDTLWFQVFEPAKLQTGHSYPLVVTSHGYGGTRATTPDAFIQKLIDNGYYVISIDERGFGQSSGTVRVMDPE